MFKRLSQDEIKEIVPFLGVLSDMELSRRYRVSNNIIFRLRTKLKIDAKPLSKEPNIDIHCFDNMNHVSAYWLGYLFADGCLYEDETRNIVSLSSTDKEVIEKFSKFLKYKIEYRTSKVNNKDNYSLNVSNEYLYKKLQSYGITNRKTFILKNPNINDRFIFSFLLGYFDGDGSISYNTKINSWKVSIGFASQKFYEWFNFILDKNNIIYSVENNRKTNVGNSFYVTVMNGVSAKQFLKLCYKNVPFNIPLKRKLNKFNELSTIEYFKPPDFQNWELDLIKTYGVDDGIIFINKDKRNYGWKRGKESTLRVLKRKGIFYEI